MPRIPLQRWAAACAVTAALAVPVGASAAEELNLADWLARPGVRLVAVEFYATWCKPCMAAMKDWARLKEAWRKQGLRIIVVNTLDPQGGCRAIGWSPDETVCDLDGRIAETFRLNGQLPAAFLWSWQGNLLVAKGHVAEIETEIQRYLKDSPRLATEAGAGIGAPMVAALRERLTDDGKLTVVAGDAERALLQKAARKAAAAGFDDKLQCEVGREAPPNSVLKVSKVGQGKSMHLTLAMLDLETGCLSQVVSAQWEGEVREIAAEAVGKLLGRLKRGGLQMPGGAPRPVGASASPTTGKDDTKIVEEAARQIDLGAIDEVAVEFISEPEAVVRVDGKMLCQKTPCKRDIAVGHHDVEFDAEGYVGVRRSEIVSAKNRKIAAKLTPDFALLNVSTSPAGVRIDIDGESATTPVVNRRLAAGKPHAVKLVDPCFLAVEERFTAARGEVKSLQLATRPRKAGLKIKAEDTRGDSAELEVRIDGAVVGVTPWRGEVAVCSKLLQVGPKNYNLKMSEGQVQELKVVVDAAQGRAVAGQGGPVPPVGQGPQPSLGGDRQAPAYAVVSRSQVKDPPQNSSNTTAYRDNGDGTVWDPSLRVFWQKGDSRRGLGWADASAYCAGLTVGGQRGWRLPSIFQLVSLLDQSRGYKQRIPDVFGPPWVWYWSGNPIDTDPTSRFWVDFYNGWSGVFKDTSQGYVRCVRP